MFIKISIFNYNIYVKITKNINFLSSDSTVYQSICTKSQKVKGINEKRILLISQDNIVKIAALNICLAHATGDWITIFDHDDYYHKDYFKNLVKCILTQADVIVGYFKYPKEYDESATYNVIELTEDRLILGKEITIEYF
jgi:cellulose synthase/poly-beta-1,6-N-acetylglucosamine synthase-like glycosyltransferase